MNINIIKERKRLYGDNFQTIANKWSEELGFEITAQKVAKMMALFKEARIEHTSQLIEERKELAIEPLMNSLRDSVEDRDNYKWIADNFDEYSDIG